MSDFSKYTNSTGEENFTSVVFGSQSPIIEVDVNEMQEIQKNMLNRIVKQFVGDGISDLSKLTFNTSTNVLTIASGVIVSVGGYVIDTKQDVTFNVPSDIGNYTISLYAWEEIATYQSELTEGGLVSSSATPITNPIMDSRYEGVETSRRKVLKYKVALKSSASSSGLPSGYQVLDLALISVYSSGAPNFDKLVKYLPSLSSMNAEIGVKTVNLTNTTGDTESGFTSSVKNALDTGVFSDLGVTYKGMITGADQIWEYTGHVLTSDRSNFISVIYSNQAAEYYLCKVSGVWKPLLSTVSSAGRMLQKSGPTISLYDYCTSITDWNQATKTGFYMGYNASNAPVSNQNLVGIVVARNDTSCIQIVFCETDSSPLYIRFRANDGIWKSWGNKEMSDLARFSQLVGSLLSSTVINELTDSIILCSTTDPRLVTVHDFLTRKVYYENYIIILVAGSTSNLITYSSVSSGGISAYPKVTRVYKIMYKDRVNVSQSLYEYAIYPFIINLGVNSHPFKSFNQLYTTPIITALYNTIGEIDPVGFVTKCVRLYRGEQITLHKSNANTFFKVSSSFNINWMGTFIYLTRNTITIEVTGPSSPSSSSVFPLSYIKGLNCNQNDVFSSQCVKISAYSGGNINTGDVGGAGGSDNIQLICYFISGSFDTSIFFQVTAPSVVVFEFL